MTSDIVPSQTPPKYSFPSIWIHRPSQMVVLATDEFGGVVLVQGNRKDDEPVGHVFPPSFGLRWSELTDSGWEPARHSVIIQFRN